MVTSSFADAAADADGVKLGLIVCWLLISHSYQSGNCEHCKLFHGGTSTGVLHSLRGNLKQQLQQEEEEEDGPIASLWAATP